MLRAQLLAALPDFGRYLGYDGKGMDASCDSFSNQGALAWRSPPCAAFFPSAERLWLFERRAAGASGPPENTTAQMALFCFYLIFLCM
ncbi:MAG: hypothetical protein WBG92_23785 [Thiohalocapsa sp.]